MIITTKNREILLEEAHSVGSEFKNENSLT